MRFLGILLFLVSYSSFAEVEGKALDAEGEKKLKNGEMVVLTEYKDGHAWPEVTVHWILDAPHLDTAAIFAAYEHQKEYVPNLVKSRPFQVSKNNVHVEYELDLPWPLANSKYIHGHRLEKGPNGGVQVNWYIVENENANEVKGYARFTPLENQKTRLKYVAWVDPKSFFAGIFKKIMVKDIVKNLKAVQKEVKKVKSERPALLTKYKGELQKTLMGQWVYPKK